MTLSVECIRHFKKVNYTTHYYKLRIIDFNSKSSDHCVTTALFVIISGDGFGIAVRDLQAKVRVRKRQKKVKNKGALKDNFIFGVWGWSSLGKRFSGFVPSPF